MNLTPDQIKQIKQHFSELFKQMKQMQTTWIEDASGNIWVLGKWYGDKPHFRRNFGHWSEEVLDDFKIENFYDQLFPLKAIPIPEQAKTEQNKQWADFYLRSLDNKD